MSTDGNNQENFVNEDDALLNERERLAQKCVRLEAQVSALKEVSSLRKGLLDLREAEVKDLINKLKIFEDAIEKEKESRQEKEKESEQKCLELSNKLTANEESLNVMKGNYEEKINQLSRELERSDNEYQRRTDELNDSELRNIDLQTRLDDANRIISENATTVKKLKEDMHVISERNRVFSYQMNLLNTLFQESEGTPIDFDRIRAIGDIVRESQNNPNGPLTLEPPQEEVNTESPLPSPSQNPSHSRRASLDYATIIDHIETDTRFTQDIPGEESCYKKVATIHGPQLVLSVSQTFIKLKDLILEKKFLQREIESLKHLNSKLETRVDRQERRLFTVTSELNKTWNLVAKLKQQHDKLHNSEAVLKYELHEKRKILERLKFELSRSRQQWVKVREKNLESELECKRMRAEFARRRQASSPASQESGISACSSSNEDMDVESEDDPNEKAQRLQLTTATNVDAEDCDEDDEEEEEEEDDGAVEMEVDPLVELVSDLVEEIEAVTSIDNENNTDGTTAGDEGDDDDVFHTNRANRLRRLEDASRVLYSRLMATTVQSSALSTRLAALHQHYSHDEPGGVPDFDEITMETESSVDVAYASQNPQTTTDDTEIDSQFEDTIPNTSITRANTVTGSVEVLPGDDDDEDVAILPNLIINPESTESTMTTNVMVDEQQRTRVISTDDSLSVDVETESPEILAELAISRADNQSPLLVLSTTTTTTTSTNSANTAANTRVNTHSENSTHPNSSSSINDQDEQKIDKSINNHNNEGGGSSSSSGNGEDYPSSSPTSSPDLFSRLIQQVPKRLEILKQQNCSLMDKEQILKYEMEKQKSRMESLEMENEKITQRLNEEMESKQNAISCLHKEIDDLVQTLKREKEQLSTFMKAYLDEKADLEERPSTSSSTSKKCHKKCNKCEKTFSLLKRRKQYCNTCKLAYCSDCTIETKTTKAKKEKICSKCHERKTILEATAQTFL